MKNYDVVIIGGGHAGCEAGLVCARMGKKTLLVTMTLEAIARMSCNPAIGGLAKGHLVRELDALGGQMARNIDSTGIQFRMLNRSKGPAVWAPRAQADKAAYSDLMKQVLEQEPNLELKEAETTALLTSAGRVTGVCLSAGLKISARAVIITTGTFLNGLIHIGEKSFPAGRMGEPAAIRLTDSLKKLGFETGRLKTGTPARVDAGSIDYSLLKIQPGDETPAPFSFFTPRIKQEQIPCYIGYTNPETHKIIQDNLARSPLYSGRITGVGPRYCPSIEDKIVRFANKNRHQIFFEPEGRHTNEVYLNGVSTSLPEDVQEKMLRSIKGLAGANIIRFGYAIEYDYCPPTQLGPALETKLIDNLYFAGQINGTSGYEEAACQGFMAGVNAARKIDNKKPLILDRSEAYIGVLIDDLVTKGTKEPYRMFTSRAEYRLLLRQDNADLRLMPYGYKLGLIPRETFDRLEKKQKGLDLGLKQLAQQRHRGKTAEKTLKQPGVKIQALKQKGLLKTDLPDDVLEQIEIEIKYKGYLRRQHKEVKRFKQMENKNIPLEFEFVRIHGLRKEAIEKLTDIQPVSVGQASRISGVSPADIALLLVALEADKKHGFLCKNTGS